MPLVTVEWRLDGFAAGVLFASYQLAVVLSSLLLVPLTDRLDSRWIVVGSSTLSALGNLLFVLGAHGFWSAALLRFVAGVGLIGVYLPGIRIVAEAFADRNPGASVGLFVSAFYVATNTSVLLMGLLEPSLGWRSAYGCMVALSACAPLLAWKALRRQGFARARSSASSFDLRVLANVPAVLNTVAYGAHSWELYVARAWLPALLAFSLSVHGWPHQSAAALAATWVGGVLAVGSVCVFAGGSASDRFGRTRTAGALLVVSALCSLSIGWLVNSPTALIVVLIVYGLAIGADSPIYSTAITELADRDRLGSTLALHSLGGFLPSIASPIVFGLFLDRGGDAWGWILGFMQAGSVALLGAGALALLFKHPESRRLAAGRR